MEAAETGANGHGSHKCLSFPVKFKIEITNELHFSVKRFTAAKWYYP